MTKETIAEALEQNHLSFMNFLRALSDKDFVFAPTDKWSAGQQLEHIIKSVAPVNMALAIPRILLKWNFGLTNRPSKTYEELIEKYKLKLLEGGRATGRFIPKEVSFAKRDVLNAQLNKLIKSLSERTLKYSESDLDLYILPHPLLGKLTLREMLYFTAYHVVHHEELIKKGIAGR